MFEAIKNLSPAHRFQAFLVVVILSTLSSIGTVYLSTDDCSGLANQYNTLIKNYTETLTINNQLVSDNNQKQKDFMIIKKMLDSLNGFKPEVVKKTSVKETRDEPLVEHRSYSIVRHPEDSLVVLASVREPEVRTIHNNKVIKTETTVTKMGDKHKTILDKVYKVLEKHDKQ